MTKSRRLVAARLVVVLRWWYVVVSNENDGRTTSTEKCALLLVVSRLRERQREARARATRTGGALESSCRLPRACRALRAAPPPQSGAGLRGAEPSGTARPPGSGEHVERCVAQPQPQTATNCRSPAPAPPALPRLRAAGPAAARCGPQPQWPPWQSWSACWSSFPAPYAKLWTTTRSAVSCWSWCWTWAACPLPGSPTARRRPSRRRCSRAASWSRPSARVASSARTTVRAWTALSTASAASATAQASLWA